ncbi:hypothetical protein [Streptococcus suis]|uniref:Phage protein n=1 Tax=Streptococcus suis TaxID=1307 RepID=A0A0Z8NY25_STRSU|nr:hypothetical protein [Streptococcus suis]NQF82316.1 hypothetical protein [Streptococcus suis]NQO83305.1 hypothetical protein [Streptococcus suis]NQP51894.1 hypothetical protein [Streptococcus suis]CYW35663.1 phage protein [Streptococcus suis]HEM5503604.1 hypothetical protein [Streptococcus suis]
MTSIERIREYYREHPNASPKEVSEVLKIKENTVKASISKDVKNRRAVRLDNGGIDYTDFFEKDEWLKAFREYQKEILEEQIEVLREANRREIDSNQIRLNAREIRMLLNDLARL